MIGIYVFKNDVMIIWKNKLVGSCKEDFENKTVERKSAL